MDSLVRKLPCLCGERIMTSVVVYSGVVKL